MAEHEDTTDPKRGATIEDYFEEDRTFPPPEGLAAAALTADRSLFDRADADFEGFWADQARELAWFERF